MNPLTTPNQAQLKSAEQALIQGDFERCAQLAEAVLNADTINLSAHLFRGIASHHLGALDQSIADLMYVLERQPDNLQAGFHLGQALRKSQQFDAAMAQLKPALEVPALRPHALFEMARCLHALDSLDKSIDHYRRLLLEVPGHADAAANLAVLLEKTDQLDEALNWAERATVLAPRNQTAQLTRARVMRRLGKYKQAAQQLTDLLKEPMPPRTHVIAINQLARCLDSLGRYPEAFEKFSEANRLHWEEDPDAGIDDRACYGIEMAAFMRNWLQEHPPADWSPTPPDDREPPVFLVGFPRSGASLLDKTLTAHPRIAVLKEQELFLEVRRRWMSAEGFPGFHRMSEAEIREARQLYRQARAAANRDRSAEVVIDRLSLNSMYLHLIYRLFPDARIIFSQRDPRDVCVSCFFHTFSMMGANPYFLELDSTARYFDAVMKLAGEARRTLPLNEMTVRYEDMAENPDLEARRTIDFIGLPWSNKVSDTLAAQDRQATGDPWPRQAVGHWRNYAAQLASVQPLLTPWVKSLGYAQD